MTWTGIPGSGPVALDGSLTFLTDATFNIGGSLNSRPAVVFSPQFQAERSGAALGWFRSHPVIALIELGTTSAHDVSIITNSVDRWHITAGGIFQAATDNVNDIGVSGANRPRDLWLGRNLSAIGTASLGALIVNGTTALGRATIYPASTTDVALLIRGIASQTGDFLELQNSAANLIFQFAATASMVDGLQFNPANAGGTPSIVAIGVDATIALTIQSKGAAGGLNLVAGTSANMQFTAGAYQFTQSNPVFIRDANNNTLLTLQQVAASTLYPVLSPAVAGGLVSLAVGGGVNVGLLLDSAGTGLLRLLSAGADIQWGKPLVALGGGLAPTLGTIGGTGPATAAQNSWMRAVDSTGAAFWVPVWK